ncbi:DUF4158 domain-containing protein [Actinopolymorpha sp. B11F2]|uniref:DUF4158 domain-containing protein n=1 Tax=Actinopolymorpha sp. B11F2 TaxID=3160862 RepID=UPI0032E4B480
MPEEFLSAEQVAAYRRYARPPTRAELDRFFFLDEKAQRLIGPKRLPHTRLGFAVQLTTAQYLGAFVPDPTDVPSEVVDYLAVQLDIADPSCLKDYREREMTRLEHAQEIRDAYALRDFIEVEAQLAARVDDRAWTTGEGPRALFDGGGVAA